MAPENILLRELAVDRNSAWLLEHQPVQVSKGLILVLVLLQLASTHDNHLHIGPTLPEVQTVEARQTDFARLTDLFAAPQETLQKECDLLMVAEFAEAPQLVIEVYNDQKEWTFALVVWAILQRIHPDRLAFLGLMLACPVELRYRPVAS